MPPLVRTAVLAVPLFLLLAAGDAVRGQEQEPSRVLFRDVAVFDGTGSAPTPGHVLVEGEVIRTVSADPIDAPEGTLVVEGGGRLLCPGFIDLHSHLTAQMPMDQANVHPWVAGALAGDAARSYLDHGFTTIRDAGGTHPDVALAIDAGLIEGPRLFPSGAIVSQTGGHGDMRARHDGHPTLGCGGSLVLGHGFNVLADGVPQTLTAVRENLRLGATQIKIMGGGGVASDYDPIHTLQPTPEEIRAAVQAASDWGTYVLAHSYTAPAIRRLVENGVRVIEHGLLIDDETARLCAEQGVVISTQVAVFRNVGDTVGMEERHKVKLAQVLEGQDRLMELVKKYDITIGFGTDYLFGMVDRVGEEFTARADYFEPIEILTQATSESAEVIRLCGKLNRHGDFGEIREGWLADLVLLDGDPLADISILERPEESVRLVMKGGEIVRDRRE